MLNHFTFLVVLFLSLSVSAQNPSHFTIGADELANIDVYTLLYDDRTDILYAGTNRGVYKYTQNKFRELKGDDNQIGDSFFQLSQDKDGNIFCCNLNGQVFKVEENSISLFYESEKKEYSRKFSFYFDSENNLITTSFFKIRKISPTGEEMIIYDSSDIQISGSTFKYHTIQEVKTFGNDSSYFFLNAKDGDYLAYVNGKLTHHSIPVKDNIKRPAFFSFGDAIFLKAENTIYNLSTDQQVNNDLQWKSYSEFFEYDHNLVIERNNGSGIRFLGFKNGTIQAIKTSFKDQFISALAKNNQNTLFLGTFKEGILVVRDWQDQKNISNLPYSGIVSTPDNRVFLSTRKGEIFAGDNGPKLHLKKERNIDELFYLKGSYTLDNYKLSNIIFNDSENNDILFQRIKDLVEIDDDFIVWTDGATVRLLFNSNSEHLHPSFPEKLRDNFYSFTPKKRCISVQYLEAEERIYYSSNSGLFSKRWDSSISNSILFEGNSILGNDLEVYQDILIIASEKKGLLFYKDGKFLKQLTENEGLSSNTILKLKIKDSFLYLLTKNGLQIYDLLDLKFREIGLNEGLMTDRVVNFSLSNDKLWILDKEGYYSIELNNLTLDKPMEIGNIYLDSIIFNNDKINVANQTTFTYDQNQLRIYFDYRDLETKNETKIYYKLDGVSDQWKILDASSNSIEFPILPPGEYTFQVKAKFRNQETKTIQYSFQISPPFWLTWWFTALCFLTVGLVISSVFIIQLRRVKRERLREFKQQKLQTDVFDSQLKAIRSQMNPHFIFNSLNSIQALVLRQDTERSYDYIVMFSDLMRKTLQFSEQEYTPLNEETDFLEIYLQLETLRMKEDFTYSIEVKGTDSIQIPSLLTQPFLENSIHHGLLHKEGKKQLTVIYECSENSASCTIIDNGIGRSEALIIKERQKGSYTSFSLNAVNQRLRILSEQNNQSYSYEIEDLYDSAGKPSGTKIIVSFPFKHDY